MKPVHGILPTLTEVIELERVTESEAAVPAPLAPESLPLESDRAAASHPTLADQHAALAAAVLDGLEPRIDSLLEAHLNSALAPQLQRLVREAIGQVRGEMAASLHALLAQAIDDALAQRRKP